MKTSSARVDASKSISEFCQEKRFRVCRALLTPAVASQRPGEAFVSVPASATLFPEDIINLYRREFLSNVFPRWWRLWRDPAKGNQCYSLPGTDDLAQSGERNLWSGNCGMWHR
jgi:hypothetical protein